MDMHGPIEGQNHFGNILLSNVSRSLMISVSVEDLPVAPLNDDYSPQGYFVPNMLNLTPKAQDPTIVAPEAGPNEDPPLTVATRATSIISLSSDSSEDDFQPQYLFEPPVVMDLLKAVRIFVLLDLVWNQLANAQPEDRSGARAYAHQKAAMYDRRRQEGCEKISKLGYGELLDEKANVLLFVEKERVKEAALLKLALA
ncbi:hypothetical protein C8F04DRAFT_1179650 [Mycena alexandri]|uniref:Uncharacterized protein n=1 Tax=Mycena alexandri TaxID=1745969 RepID=A0AAD6T390_9AGAR|nr:hypothetical protein C8F04DRAFT_1179650 [Mycena alexandri]